MLKKNFIIDCLVIGSQKCATSWLYLCLKDHPQLCLPKQKKEIEYIGGKLYDENGLDWYLGLFDNCRTDQKKCDVSVEYIVNPKSPQLLKEFFPDLKLILSIRNPAKRALSALKWYIRKGNVQNKSDTILHSVKAAIENFESKEYELMKFDYHDILYRGVYYKLIKQYLTCFEAHNILIVNYEDIKKEPLKSISKIYNFLDVKPDFVPSSLAVQPKKNSNNRFLVKLESLFAKSSIITSLIDRLHQNLPDKEEFFSFEKELTQMLNAFYEPYNNDLRKLISENDFKVTGELKF
jgi:hypothetical protein